MSIKIQVNFKAIGSNGCAPVREREQPHVVRRCAVQRAKGQTSQILSFVGYHLILSSSLLHPPLHPLPHPFQSLRIPTSVPPHTTPPPSPPNTRPLKSALTACLLATFHRHSQSARPVWPSNPPFIQKAPTHGVPPPPPSYPAPTPPRSVHRPFAHRSSSESPRRARPMLALSHFVRSLQVALELPPRARPRLPCHSV